MTDRMTKEELANKIEWEGGIYATVQYGIRFEELPADAPVKVLNAWEELQNVEIEKHEDIIRDWLESDDDE